MNVKTFLNPDDFQLWHTWSGCISSSDYLELAFHRKPMLLMHGTIF
jgi:hypothetical protein